MDPRRFDSLTRSLAEPKTRRGVLGSLAALGAGLLGARATGAQVTQARCGNVVCYNRGTNTVDVACAPGCVCCVYGNGNSRCRPPQECSGTVVSPTTTTTTSTTTSTPSTTTTTTTTQAPTTTTTTSAPLLGLGEACTSAAQCDQSGGQTLCAGSCCRADLVACFTVEDCCNCCNDGTCGPCIG